MNIWSKLITALRGGANEVGEAIIDNQAMRILDQEIREADEELKRSKDALAEIMAKHKVAEEKSVELKKQIEEYESYAIQALEKQQDTLAQEVAEKIAGLEVELKNQLEVASGYAHSVTNLRKAVKQAEGNLKRLRQQADTVRATASVQKAQAAVAHRHSGSNAKLQTAMDSLERIKQKQKEQNARMQAAEELAADVGEDALTEKLRAAGIAPGVNSAEAVLARLKQKSSK